MCWIRTIIYICFITFILYPGQGLSKKAEYRKFIRVFKFENCETEKFKNPRYEITYFNVTSLNLYQQVVNARFRLNPPLPKVIMVKTSIQRCKSINFDSCLEGLRMNGNLYDLLKSFRNVLEKQVFGVIEPSMSIPFSPGEYKVVNLTGDIEPILPYFKRAAITGLFEDYWNVQARFCDRTFKEMSCSNHMSQFFIFTHRKNCQLD